MAPGLHLCREKTKRCRTLKLLSLKINIQQPAWNALPNHIRDLKTLNIFKAFLRRDHPDS